MKNLIIVFCCIILACNTSGNDQETEQEQKKKDKKVSSRDYSITPANAYNDIFIDSLTVASYIDTIDASDKVKRRITSFYNARNYQFAWFASDGLTEHARGFWNLYSYDATHTTDSLQRDKKLQLKMDNLFAQSNVSVNAKDRNLQKTELTLTKLFIEHGLSVYEKGYVTRKEGERFIPLKKIDPIQYSDSLLTKKKKEDKYYDEVNESYGLLKQQLAKYVDIAKRGGWPEVTMKEKSLKPGATSPTILAIKKRLQSSGDYNGQDTTALYDPSLESAIKVFQHRHGYTPSGIIGASTIKELNLPVNTLIEKLLINLHRMRWMPGSPEGNLIVVNIPEFVMHVWEGKQKVFDMNVVVGKEGNNTVIFTDDLNQVVFSPHWNVPESIVREEILPAMSRNPNYLASQNMEIVSDKGELPTIRQLPGRNNSLGKVKFLFPNSFNIYFHDTPSKSLFNRDKRAFSHGCIRVQEPEKLANYLLRNQPEWTPERINAAMNSAEEKFVKLDKAVPVFITYYTAWVDEQGLLNLRDDIYGHDAKVASKMFVRQSALAAK